MSKQWNKIGELDTMWLLGHGEQDTRLGDVRYQKQSFARCCLTNVVKARSTPETRSA